MAEFGRAVGEILIGFAVFDYGIYAFVWKKSADEDGFAAAFFTCDYIHAVVHAVGEVDVGVAGRVEHGSSASGGFTAKTVAGSVVFGVGFGFYDGASDELAGGELFVETAA